MYALFAVSLLQKMFQGFVLCETDASYCNDRDSQSVSGFDCSTAPDLSICNASRSVSIDCCGEKMQFNSLFTRMHNTAQAQ